MVRGYVEDILTEEGYQVLLASTAEEALATVQDFRGPIHLLLTDIVMPGLNGRQLAEQLSPVRQDTKVLFMSGYTDDAIIREGIQLTRVEFLAKPFSPSLLLQRVTRVLAQSSPRPLPPT
jgi:DNA-binding response OmpR family regulator